MDSRRRARELAEEALSQGDAHGWFEQLYREAAQGSARIPWADEAPNPHLVGWFDRELPEVANALVIGCGVGDDSEWLAEQGLEVVAFDISPTAIETVRRRFPRSEVKYEVTDLLSLPTAWSRSFDFVFEAYTLQVLPPDLRPAAMARIAATVADGGILLVVSRGRESEQDTGQMPWPLTRAEFAPFVAAGLEERIFEDFHDDEVPPVRRFRITYGRQGNASPPPWS